MGWIKWRSMIDLGEVCMKKGPARTCGTPTTVKLLAPACERLLFIHMSIATMQTLRLAAQCGPGSQLCRVNLVGIINYSRFFSPFGLDLGNPQGL